VELRVPLYVIPRELKVPGTDQPLWNKIQFVAFCDAAYARLQDAAAGERPSRTFIGLGGGLRFDLPNHWTGRFEWAAPTKDRPSGGSGSRFYFQLGHGILNFFYYSLSLPNPTRSI